MISSVILALYFLGFLEINTTIGALYVLAVLLFIAEVGIVSFGILSLNAIMALYAAYALQTGPDAFFGFDIGWGLFFGVSFVEFMTIFIGVILWKKHKNRKNPTGTEGMIGQNAKILSWSGLTGRAQFEGEPWNAQSKTPLSFNQGDLCVIVGVEKNILIIAAP